MREIVLDTETTGLNYKAGDRIIEVGCVELINMYLQQIICNFIVQQTKS